MLLQKISFEIFAENFVVAFMKSDAVIIKQTKGVDFSMKFFISFRFIKFKTKSLHDQSLRKKFNILQKINQEIFAAYIPIAKARGFSAHFGKQP